MSVLKLQMPGSMALRHCLLSCATCIYTTFRIAYLGQGLSLHCFCVGGVFWPSLPFSGCFYLGCCESRSDGYIHFHILRSRQTCLQRRLERVNGRQNHPEKRRGQGGEDSLDEDGKFAHDGVRVKQGEDASIGCSVSESCNGP